MAVCYDDDQQMPFFLSVNVWKCVNVCRYIEESPNLTVNGEAINNVRYADNAWTLYCRFRIGLSIASR